MTSPFAVFRCEARRELGTGHVMRCLALAEALAERGWRCGFAVAPGSTDTVQPLGRSGFDVREATTAEEVRAAWPDGARIVIVDNYALGAAFESALRGWAEAVVAIDDLADRPHDCDLLIDSAAEPGRYDGLIPRAARTLLGPAYALLRPEFHHMRLEGGKADRASDPPHVVVSLGGTDPQAVTATAIDWLSAAATPLRVTAVLGKAAAGRDRAEASAAASPHAVTLRHQIDDMAALLADADLAVGGGGNSAWERCCLGVPTLLVLLADNQATVARRVADAGAGLLAKDVADSEIAMAPSALDALLGDADERAAMAAAARGLCDGLGTARVAVALECLVGRLPRTRMLRPVVRADAPVILDWQRHPDTRRWFRNPAVPEEDEHNRWLAAKLCDPACILHRVDEAGEPVGLVRLDRRGAEWEVSILVAPKHRGRGVGRDALALIRGLMPAARLTAEIRSGNTASHRLFQAAGYRRSAPERFVSEPTADGASSASNTV